MTQAGNREFPLELDPKYWTNCICSNQDRGYCITRRTMYNRDDRTKCCNLTSEQRRKASYNSQANVRHYSEFIGRGFDDKWYEYYFYVHTDVTECFTAKLYQHKKDIKVIKYLEDLEKQKLTNGFDKLQIACVGHYPKQFDSIGDSPVLKKVNLNDLDVGEYQNNRWAESRAFVAKDLFRDDAEWIGYVGASWNDKFDGPKIEDFTEWPYSKHLVNSKELVFCAHVNCACSWQVIISNIIKEHDGIFEKLQELFDLEIKHVKVPYCNHFIAHRSIVEEYLNYLDSEQIMPKIDKFVKKEVVPGFVGEYFKHRVEAYIMEMIGCFWWAKKDYMYISNGARKPIWYHKENNEARLKAYEDSLLDKNR